MRFEKVATGDKRIVKRFAFLPVTIIGETRWLEFIKIEQQAYDVEFYNNPWHNQRFI